MTVAAVDLTGPEPLPAEALEEPQRFKLTDLGNAERLLARHGHDLRFVPAVGWFVWDGRRWRRDEAAVLRRMAETVREIYDVAARAGETGERKALFAHALKSESNPRLRGAVSLAENIDESIIVSVDALDADPWILNVENGALHLQVGELLEHERHHLLTKLAPVTYNPDAEAPRWLAFLDQVFDGDQQLIAFVQRAVGYSLTGSTEEQVLFLLHGTGANGKTTFVETMRALFGDYGQQTPAETFVERRGDTVPHDLARLPGARFVAAVETGEGKRLAETLVKRLTGGDTITARHLYREHFEFTPTFKTWLATNHKPEIRGTEEAIWRRIRLIPFAVTIPPEERDPGLLEVLRKELPGILAWAVEGCLAWRYDKLDPPAAVTQATSAYRDEMDVLREFLEERCITDPQARVKASELYTRYGYWATENGETRPLSQKALARRLEERGFTRERTNNARWWRGLGLLEETERR